ncbi:hypothetical protein FQA47_025547 [Oryzias melastigma]|uniref:Uncharacterized protein n=1 Tax=Oryzias melastigma TaxID=30732 RepID=A0A834C3Q9_ORYME|nr:hypothetical protein FQA47_025547 [Oryzias melastigma]
MDRSVRLTNQTLDQMPSPQSVQVSQKSQVQTWRRRLSAVGLRTDCSVWLHYKEKPRRAHGGPRGRSWALLPSDCCNFRGGNFLSRAGSGEVGEEVQLNPKGETCRCHAHVWIGIFTRAEGSGPSGEVNLQPHVPEEEEGGGGGALNTESNRIRSGPGAGEEGVRQAAAVVPLPVRCGGLCVAGVGGRKGEGASLCHLVIRCQQPRAHKYGCGSARGALSPLSDADADISPPMVAASIHPLDCPPL